MLRYFGIVSYFLIAFFVSLLHRIHIEDQFYCTKYFLLFLYSTLRIRNDFIFMRNKRFLIR